MHIWKDRPPSAIVGFLQSYTFSKDAAMVNRDNLTKYIERQNAKDELRLWDVVVPRGNREARIPTVGRTMRLRGAIMRSPTNEELDRGAVESRRISPAWKNAAGRTGNDPDRGCLMLYAIDKNSGTPKKTFFTSPSRRDGHRRARAASSLIR